MKLLFISILLFSFTGCSMFMYKPLNERREDCAARFVKLDVDGLDASKMCTEIYRRK